MIELPTLDTTKTLKAVEREYIEFVLKANHGRLNETARVLGISRAALIRRLKGPLPVASRGAKLYL